MSVKNLAMILKEILFAALCLFLAEGSFAQGSKLTADQIIQRMTDVYSSAKTYQDSGSVFLVKDINVFKGQNWSDVLVVNSFDRVEKVTFSFCFQRPNHLRFEWIDKATKVTRPSVVWSNSKGVFSWRTNFDEPDATFILDKESSLKWAIDEETRGSMSVADLLYNTLNGSKEFYSFSKMTDAKMIRKEPIAGNDCFVILGVIGHDPWALWIDKKSYVLRRYRTQIATGSFDESVITGFMPTTLGEFNHDEIKLNVAIPKSKFNFTPKLRKGDVDISKYKDEKAIAPSPPMPPKKPNEQ